MKRQILTILSAAVLSSGAAAQEVMRDTTIQAVRIGYLDVSRSALAGAVDQVTAERMNKGLITSSLDALNGQAAGVQITGNQEAMVSAVRVRGTTSLTGGNDPLVIIDGVMTDLGALSAIFPPTSRASPS